MEKLSIIIPSVREHLLYRCISSMDGYPGYPVTIIAQKIKPIYTHHYFDEYLTIFGAFAKGIEMALPSEYYFLIDDDFIFREGYRENILHAIHVLDTKPDIGCIIFSDNKNKKSQNNRIDVDLIPGMLHILAPKEIVHARKESGLIIRRELLKEVFENTAHGEDFSKIIHCYLDGYDIGMIKANITHEHNPKDDLSWDKLSKELFGEYTKYDVNHFYYRVLKDMKLLDNDGLTEAGLKTHEYNKRRRQCKYLNTKD